MTIFFAWIRLFFFFEVGELTTHSVGSNIRFTMSTVRIDLLDDRAADEMELFALSISSNYPNININGFTWVSRKVLLAIMEQAMLYILVLIQIQTAR
ncbi:hypothetical protein GE061_013815 [Apolygus lucorum]|uniref:Uncharacterized protein n=1 Tax=Apolygus lucorum TaxID=248454 RepID=A0A6A4JZX7_APOLU|nr:hypothetical protein GE061_013815 [Apolygus lucorum]